VSSCGDSFFHESRNILLFSDQSQTPVSLTFHSFVARCMAREN
jgi:hypothetical protein